MNAFNYDFDVTSFFFPGYELLKTKRPNKNRQENIKLYISFSLLSFLFLSFYPYLSLLC